MTLFNQNFCFISCKIACKTSVDKPCNNNLNPDLNGLNGIIGCLLLTKTNLSDNPNQMLIFSIIGGLLSVIIGLFASLEINTPSGPSIITSGLILFILSLTKIKKKSQLNN